MSLANYLLLVALVDSVSEKHVAKLHPEKNEFKTLGALTWFTNLMSERGETSCYCWDPVLNSASINPTITSLFL